MSPNARGGPKVKPGQNSPYLSGSVQKIILSWKTIFGCCTQDYLDVEDYFWLDNVEKGFLGGLETRLSLLLREDEPFQPIFNVTSRVYSKF